MHQEDEGNQTLHWQPTNGTCTKMVQNQQHKFCYLPKFWVLQRLLCTASSQTLYPLYCEYLLYIISARIRMSF